MKFLSPLQPLKRHLDIRSSRVEDTGSWILEAKQFQRWQSGADQLDDTSNRVLCCYGDPGTGKTFLRYANLPPSNWIAMAKHSANKSSSIVIDYLLDKTARHSEAAVACIYCDYRYEGTQVLVNILGSIVSQLANISNSAAGPVSEVTYKEVIQVMVNCRGAGLSRDAALTLLRNLLQRLDKAFICVDALDELSTKVRVEVLQALTDILARKNTRLFLTSRPHIQDNIVKILELPSNYKFINIAAHEEDIRRYINHQLQSDQLQDDAMSPSLQENIISTITSKSQGMYVSLLP